MAGVAEVVEVVAQQRRYPASGTFAVLAHVSLLEHVLRFELPKAEQQVSV